MEPWTIVGVGILTAIAINFPPLSRYGMGSMMWDVLTLGVFSTYHILATESGIFPPLSKTLGIFLAAHLLTSIVIRVGRRFGLVPR